MTKPREHVIHSKDGTRVGAVTVGSGPPLVMVHGAWNWAEHWLPVAEGLADSRTCWVMDRRGRGASGDSDHYEFDREIEDIAAVMDAAGPDASLLGHSSGAIYALETVRRRGADRLVVYEPPLRWVERGDPMNLVERLRALVSAGKDEEAAELFYREEGRLDDEGIASLKALPEWETITALAPVFIREADAIVATGLGVDSYAELTTPTLVLAGSENLDHPSMATQSLSATLPDARTAVLEGHGHAANRTDPRLVAEEVAHFLDANAP